MNYGGTSGRTDSGGTARGSVVAIPKLSTKKVAALKEPRMYGDGEGLCLRVGPTGAKLWILRTRIAGRFTESGNPLRWEVGLGGINQVTLAEARERARERRKVAKPGDDPSLRRDRQELTFKAAAEGFFYRTSTNLAKSKACRNLDRLTEAVCVSKDWKPRPRNHWPGRCHGCA